MAIPTFDSGLTPEQTENKFEFLQRKLAPLWESIERFNDRSQTIVVIPSISVDYPLAGSLLQAYEERLLFLLFLLRQPRARMIYVTSQPILPSVIDYYLHLLPGVIAGHARNRLHLLSPFDGSAEPLSIKLLNRPPLLENIRSLIPDMDRVHMVPFNTTPLERDLAIRLGIPMYAADPKFFEYGTKSGCRKIFGEENVNHPIGENDLIDIQDLIEAISGLRREKPDISNVLVKINEGVSGDGNALVNLENLPPPGDSSEKQSIRERLYQMQFEAPGEQFDNYMQRLGREKGIVEEWLSGVDFRSPSVQMRITPLGKVEVLSTHDQVLGGAGGQTFMGCRFPADVEYSAMITRESLKIGHRLAREGVIGRFAVDFVTTRNKDSQWQSNAIEINLRKGGTTHPFLTLQFLTDGKYDEQQSCFFAPDGKRKYFTATDYLKSDDYRIFTPDDLFDIVARHNLHFDQSLQTGIVMHMMSAVGEHGRFGFTAVGNSKEDADDLYNRTVKVFTEEANERTGSEMI